MTQPFEFHPAVEPEADEAYHWYERKRRGLGEEFLAEVDAALARIAAAPDSAAIIYRDVRVVRTRRFPYGIYYRIVGDQIRVVAVMHSRRRPSVWKSRVP